ncbi:Uu.00g144990.m01.CDS01 [Anthostomella pinea]|uniref:Uu.00g144990.m01.CDS01 n=1 Tax=Anthostomella pinea TaxID=933095 RepID=A0AAI8VQZ6_9PEZI|nr:Uu.00g144990.m01.CDS01 [Anthostomella pinea]
MRAHVNLAALCCILSCIFAISLAQDTSCCDANGVCLPQAVLEQQDTATLSTLAGRLLGSLGRLINPGRFPCALLDRLVECQVVINDLSTSIKAPSLENGKNDLVLNVSLSFTNCRASFTALNAATATGEVDIQLRMKGLIDGGLAKKRHS